MAILSNDAASIFTYPLWLQYAWSIQMILVLQQMAGIKMGEEIMSTAEGQPVYTLPRHWLLEETVQMFP